MAEAVGAAKRGERLLDAGVEIWHYRGGLLHAPIRTEMHQRVDETLDAVIHIKHTDRDGSVLLEGKGLVGAMEVHGDLKRLLAI